MVQQIQNLVVEERKKTKHPLKTQIQSLGPGFQDPTEKRKQKQKKKNKKKQTKRKKGGENHIFVELKSTGNTREVRKKIKKLTLWRTRCGERMLLYRSEKQQHAGDFA